MDIAESAEHAAFRAEARAWLNAHATPRTDSTRQLPLDEHIAMTLAWQRTLFEHGWAGLSWPEAFGGRGLSSTHASIFAEEMSDFEENLGPFTVALGMVAPTLMAHGTPDQQKHISAILKGEELWCQLFSEPGAGSDLAAVATRAELDGEVWTVNGQKVWTSLGQFARYGILLARTDPDLPKHKGLTYFLVDMDQPGVEVRPLVQMTGHAHFNETFLTDVQIPAMDVVGEINEGWKVARTTLTAERSSIAGGSVGWSSDGLIELAQTRGLTDDPVMRQELARTHTRSEIMRILNLRLRSAVANKRLPGREALIMKLAYARHWVASTGTGMAALGAHGMLAGDDAPHEGQWHHAFLNQYAIRLGGGTDEVQQNIAAELGLGLPREPSTDRLVPWKDLPK